MTNPQFSHTDIDDSKLIGSSVINSTFAHNKTGCQVTFDDDYSAYWVYFINFLGTLAVLPGNIVSALLMDKVGRLSMLGKPFDPIDHACILKHVQSCILGHLRSETIDFLGFKLVVCCLLLSRRLDGSVWY